MTYTVTINYFDKAGNQKQKELSRKTVAGLMNALTKFNDNHEIYTIPYLSQNLYADKEFNDHINQYGWQ